MCVTVATLHQLQESGCFKDSLNHRQHRHLFLLWKTAALIFGIYKNKKIWRGRKKKSYSTISAQIILSSFTNHPKSNLTRWYVSWYKVRLWVFKGAPWCTKYLTKFIYWASKSFFFQSKLIEKCTETAALRGRKCENSHVFLLCELLAWTVELHQTSKQFANFLLFIKI